MRHFFNAEVVATAEEMAKILIVDDDKSLCAVLADLLESGEYEVECVYDGREGLHRLLHYNYDIAVVDWDIPHISGPELCSQYRDQRGSAPILMLTGKSSISEKETGFGSGADDYLVKPFDERELVVRIRAMLRRPHAYVDTSSNVGGLKLDQRTRLVHHGEKSAELLPMEFKLLQFLMQHKDHFFTSEELLNRVWSSESDSSPEALRQCIKRLRRKLESIDARSCIDSSRGSGYKFAAIPAKSPP